MDMKTKTKYQARDGQLFYEGNPTDIRIIDSYFYQGNKFLNIYQEDGHLFILKPLIPFLKWPMISSPVDLSIDKDGFVWGANKNNIFDQFVIKKN